MYLTPDISEAMYWYNASSAGWTFAPTVFVHFYIHFAEKTSKFLKRFVLILLYSSSVLFFMRELNDSLLLAELVRGELFWSEKLKEPDRWLFSFTLWAISTPVLAVGIHLFNAKHAVRSFERRRSFILAAALISGVLLILAINVILPLISKSTIPAIGGSLTVIPSALSFLVLKRYGDLSITPVMAIDKILNNINDGILLTDDLHLVRHVNYRIQNLWNDQPPLNCPVTEYLIIDEIDLSIPGRFESELKINRLPVTVDVVPFFNRWHDYLGAVISIKDISNLKKLEAEIEERQKLYAKLQITMNELVQANQARSDFFSRISHDMRTPLNAILGAGEMLTQELPEKSESPMLDLLKRASRNLNVLIDNLLDFHRLEKQNLQFEQKPFSPVEIISDVIAILKTETDKKPIKIIQDLNLPDFVNGDAKAFRQIMINLYSNSVKFTESGSIQIKAVYEANRIIITITDTGVGIPEEFISKLYNPFEQADASITRKYGGAGLGLAIVKEFTDRMNGSIHCKSKSGQYTEFTVEIPAQISEKPQELKSKSTTKKLPASKVLLVEDSVDNQQITVAFLKSHPVEITIASNGFEAIEKFEANSFDLILMDIQMPGMDGLSAVKKIRQIESQTTASKRTVILAFTAHGESESKTEAIEAGCDDILFKPIKRSVLIEKLLRNLPQSL